VQQRSYEEGPNFDKSTSNEDQPFWETTKSEHRSVIGREVGR